MEFTKHYLTYAEYKALGGTLEETPFNVLELKAQKEIDRYTFGRLQTLPTQVNEVKVCDYELIKKLDNYQNAETNQAKGISSESTDGYSISYGTKTSDSVSSMNKDIENCIKIYLSECKLEDGTPYLYCGVV